MTFRSPLSFLSCFPLEHAIKHGKMLMQGAISRLQSDVLQAQLDQPVAIEIHT
jgi:hypothetical protein